ncbi:MAG: hypothetical protein KKC79_16020 [Gammaproteobacteria bacterium]|nr:hypothetical protein [Gammaproteobacteria bacterium]MBU1443546.1 hypothetical protein [Gammaproteobacteria bacterium]MBU2287847.1 hypothetical protein [Gammaproteobacteria bacterium]MBU2410143.1 hypothetical protein [Gammaproteobacteria bacterium]
MTSRDTPPIRILLHAPTADGLLRARKNAANVLKDAPQAEVRIFINSEAVAAALDQPDAVGDRLTWVCPNTLRNLSREPAASMRVLPHSSVLELAKLQGEGWAYVRT